jgi:hypothetical protein
MIIIREYHSSKTLGEKEWDPWNHGKEYDRNTKAVRNRIVIEAILPYLRRKASSAV